jgi:hypothetical protein
MYQNTEKGIARSYGNLIRCESWKTQKEKGTEEIRSKNSCLEIVESFY